MSIQISEESLGEYIAEGREILERLNAVVGKVEKEDLGGDVLDSFYRDIHTLKGTSQLFGFGNIGQLTHVMESCLDPVRKNRMHLDQAFIDIIFSSIDLIEKLISEIETARSDERYADDVQTLIFALIDQGSRSFSGENGVVDNEAVSETIEELAAMKEKLLALSQDAQANEAGESGPDEVSGTDTTEPAIQAAPENVSPAEQDDILENIESIAKELVSSPEFEAAEGKVVKSEPKKAPVITELGSTPLGDIESVAANLSQESTGDSTESSVAKPNVDTPVEAVVAPEPEAVVSKPQKTREARAAAPDNSIRVQVSLLDKLMNLMGELVLVRNQVLQYTSKQDDFELVNISQNLDVVTSEIQGEIMKTRMQPIGNVLTKFQRVVRDLARELNKKVDITLEGTETELDKTLLEAIKDPLTHIIRNSCDHGIEMPQDRVAAGKPDNGHIYIRAFHEGGQVIVEISDDGRGLDREKIRNRAVERGVLSPDRAASLGDREVYALIFELGFSTAEKVSSVSGRGVGMDVVKTNIEAIGGTIDLDSSMGKGTTIRLKIPLTLAIVPAMIIRCDKNRIAIPQSKLVELVRIERDRDDMQIEFLQDQPMLRLRGELLPLIDSYRVLDVVDSGLSEKRLRELDDINVVVLNAEGMMFGLIVDEVLDTADIVVKALSKMFRNLRIFSGATIMGDGAVALIIDVMGVSEHMQLHKVENKSLFDEETRAQALQRRQANSDVLDYVVVQLNNAAHHVIPRCLVHRLEEVKKDEIEHTCSKRVVQYRGSVMPIISLNEYLGYPAEIDNNSDTVNLVVISRGGRNFAIEVNDIVDVLYLENPVDEYLQEQKGIMGNILERDEVFVVVDVYQVIETEHATYAGSDEIQSVSYKEELEKIVKNEKIHVLFAEDVAFFRKQVSKVLSDRGFEVITAKDGVEALKVMESDLGKKISIVLSDIEMPNMDGLQLAREISAKWPELPLIALTTKYKKSDIADGKKAGFSLYLEKLNAEQLLEAVYSIMGRQMDQDTIKEVTA